MAFAFAAPSTPPTAAPIPVLDSPTLRELQPAISVLDSPEPSRSVWQPMISAMDSPEPPRSVWQPMISAMDSPEPPRSSWQPMISAMDSPEPPRSSWQPMISAMDSPEPLRSPSVEDWTHRFSENDWGHWIDVFGETVQETMQEPFSLQDSPRTQHLKSAVQSQFFAMSLVHSSRDNSVQD